VLAVVVAAVYLLAAARHTMVMNRLPKIHERYAFAVGPLFIALFVADAAPLGVAAIGVASVGVAIVMARIAYTALPDNTWVNAPSMTLGWLTLTNLSSSVALGLLFGGAVALVCWWARLACTRRGTLAGAAALVLPLLVLNATWYAFVYRIQADLAPMQRTIEALEARPPDSRITTVVSADRDPMASVSYYGKFWLEDRLTVYWTGSARPPWYVDTVGPAAAAARATRAAYLVGLPGEAAPCAGAVPVPMPVTPPPWTVEVVAVSPERCGSAGTR